MYEVIFDENAIDFLGKLSREYRKRIYGKIIATKDSPYRYFEKLSGRKDYRLRVGDYRVIADIDKEAEQIQVTLIGHRKNIYKLLNTDFRRGFISHN